MGYLENTCMPPDPNIKKILNLGKELTTLDINSALKFRLQIAKFFHFKNEKLEYFNHSYNNSRITERSIEIPIIKYYLKKYNPVKYLEIGNVSNHYYTYFQDLMIPKIVVDKYEKGLNVINKDIKDYVSKTKFDFIFSISTFEHMDSNRGRNKRYIKKKEEENTNIYNNIVHVIDNLLNLEGVFIITAPIGYSIEWNQIVFNQKIMSKEFLNVKSINIYYFERFEEIKWRQKNLSSIKISYMRNFIYTPYKYSNRISIVEIIK